MASTISAGTTTTTALSYSADTSGVLQLQTNGGTTAVTIDTSQNVGVGVTPSAWGSGYKAVQIQSGAVYQHTSTDFRVIQNAYYATGNSPTYINTQAASMYRQDAGTHYWYNAASGTAGTAITFTQAMLLDTSGNLGVGCTSLVGSGSISIKAGQSLQWQAAGASTVYGDIYTDSSNNMVFRNGSSPTERARIETSGNLLIGYTSSNGSYKLQVNSQIFATSSTIATSDARYKENVEELSGALDIVKSLRPVSFDWKVHPIHNFDTKTKTVGFLAQDVQQTLAGKPYLNSIIKTNECVIEPEVKDENGTVTKEAVTEEFLGIAEGNMISILTAAIKELKAEFDAYVIAHP